MPITKASGQAVAVAAKGDLVVGSATNDAAVLGVGSANQVLTVDSSTTTGLKWATASAGGMTLLSTTNTTSGNTITLSSINQTYRRLMLVGVSINRAGTASVRIWPQDGTTDVDVAYNWFSGSNQTNVMTGFAMYPDNNNGYIGNTKPLNFVLTIDNYASTTQQKPFHFYGAYHRDATGVLGFNVTGGIFSNNKIDKISVYSDQAFNAGTLFLYGVS